jgi:hypothetical protein
MGANTEKEVADGARVADQWEPLRDVWLAREWEAWEGVRVKEGSRGIWDLGLGIGDRRLEIGDLADSIQFEGENSLGMPGSLHFRSFASSKLGKKSCTLQMFPSPPGQFAH